MRWSELRPGDLLLWKRKANMSRYLCISVTVRQRTQNTVGVSLCWLGAPGFFQEELVRFYDEEIYDEAIDEGYEVVRAHP